MLKKIKIYSSNINLKFIIICFFILMFLLGEVIYLYVDDNNKIYKEVSMNYFIRDEVQKNYVGELKDKYNNSDIVGIININDTSINEVILQSNDNSYYLEHNIYKQYDPYGAIFMDYRNDINNSKKILIYGHNSSKVDTSFGYLEKYYDKAYYDNHRYITLYTDEKIVVYEIFSVYVETNDWDYMNIKFNSNKDWDYHLLKLQSKSFYDTGVSVDVDDEILILQTCSYHYDYSQYDKKYLLVVAKKI